MSSHTAPPAAKRRRKIAVSIADGSLVQFYSKSKDVDDLGLGMAGWRKVLSNFHMGVISVVSPASCPPRTRTLTRHGTLILRMDSVPAAPAGRRPRPVTLLRARPPRHHPMPPSFCF